MEHRNKRLSMVEVTVDAEARTLSAAVLEVIKEPGEAEPTVRRDPAFKPQTIAMSDQ